MPPQRRQAAAAADRSWNIVGFSKRLTNAFSKKPDNHRPAFALYAARDNLCRVHQSLRITPAAQLAITDRGWSLGDLIDAALAVATPNPNANGPGASPQVPGEKGSRS